MKRPIISLVLLATLISACKRTPERRDSARSSPSAQESDASVNSSNQSLASEGARAMAAKSGVSPEGWNRLSLEKSPYLLQHAMNPVDWYPWGKEAFAKAEKEDKPIFLSIGYSTCYWCHVMEETCFSNTELAAIMKEHFVSIKVDREERPDVDNIYMAAVVGMTGSGGWPLSVFITPEGKPFHGGTYFPPEQFKQVLLGVAQAWKEKRTELEQMARGGMYDQIGGGFHRYSTDQKWLVPHHGVWIPSAPG